MIAVERITDEEIQRLCTYVGREVLVNLCIQGKILHENSEYENTSTEELICLLKRKLQHDKYDTGDTRSNSRAVLRKWAEEAGPEGYGEIEFYVEVNEV